MCKQPQSPPPAIKIAKKKNQNHKKAKEKFPFSRPVYTSLRCNSECTNAPPLCSFHARLFLCPVASTSVLWSTINRVTSGMASHAWRHPVVTSESRGC